MRLLVIGCDVLFREICHWAAQSANVVDLQFLDQTLHREPEKLRSELQRRIDEANGYDAVVLGYGLCSNGTAYLRAKDAPLILPRAHDCITLLLGSRQRYDASFAEIPGTYYYTAGWIERAGARKERDTPQGREVNQQIYREYAEKFGEENARYLMETLHSWHVHYSRALFLRMDLPRAATYEEPARKLAQEVAEEYGWALHEEAGDSRLIKAMLDCEWDQGEFLLVPPNAEVIPSYDEGVVTCMGCRHPLPDEGASAESDVVARG